MNLDEVWDCEKAIKSLLDSQSISKSPSLIYQAHRNATDKDAFICALIMSLVQLYSGLR